MRKNSAIPVNKKNLKFVQLNFFISATVLKTETAAPRSGTYQRDACWDGPQEVLFRIADHPIKRIEELPPWNVAASLQLPAHDAA